MNLIKYIEKEKFTCFIFCSCYSTLPQVGWYHSWLANSWIFLPS